MPQNSKVVSLKMPSLPSREVADRIELTLQRLYETALDDLRKNYSEQIDAINGEAL
jgi:hypothetical protein